MKGFKFWDTENKTQQIEPKTEEPKGKKDYCLKIKLRKSGAILAHPV